MELLNLFVPLTKVDAAERLVYGTLVAEEVDKSGEIFDYATSKPMIEAWSDSFKKATDGKSEGNLRSMHTKKVAGKFTKVDCDDATKSVQVCAKVVDDGEWTMVQEGCYTGFSIGGSYAKKWPDGIHKRYTAKPSEGSLVDNPMGYSATFTMIKDGGVTELRKLHTPAAEALLAASAAPSDPPPAAPPAPAVPAPAPAAPSAPTEPPTPPTPPPPAALAKAAYAGPTQKWIAEDGTAHDKKELAKAHDDEKARTALAAKDPATALETAVAAVGASLTKMEVAKAAPPAVVPIAKDAPPGSIVPNPMPAGAPALTKRVFTDEERTSMAKEGTAMKDGSYPIANKGDLTNAIQSFGRAKDKKGTKAHIQTRAKALGAEDMLPESWKDGATKAIVFGDLRKGLYDVARLASLIQELEWLQQSSEYEAVSEKDDSTVPAALKQNVVALSASLRAMVEEETSELLTNDEALLYGEDLEMSARTRGIDALAKVMGAKAPAYLAKMGVRLNKTDKEHLDSAHDHVSKMGIGCGMAKAGARHSKADAELLTQAHDAMTKAGADCPAEGDAMAGDGKAADAGGLAKMAALTERNERLEKVVADAAVALKAYDERLVKLESQPMPRPHELHVVDKAADDPMLAKLAEEATRDPNAIARYLIHLSQQRPQTMVPAR